MCAITAYRKYGLTRNQVASLMLNFFHYPKEYLDTLQYHSVLHCSGARLRDNVINGVFYHNAVEYLVVYKNALPAETFKAQQIKLYFRVPKEEYELESYVLVKVMKEEELKKLGDIK